jgi:hypothetical protein
MTAIIISTMGNYTFGTMTLQAVSRLMSANAQMARLQDAIAQASNGYDGTPGTEFEMVVTGSSQVPMTTPPNLFGVMPSDVPGENGLAYATAATGMCEAWVAFWAAAAPFLKELDNGGTVT